MSYFAKGFRTIIAALALIIAGVLSAVGTLDLSPLVAMFVRNPATLGAAMVGIGLLFGWLRYLSTTPLFKPTPAGATTTTITTVTATPVPGEADPVMIKRGLDSGA
jgi:hypothetical protein